MTEYTVHFQKGTRVGTRSLRMVHVKARSMSEALMLARHEFSDIRYVLTRIDHFDGLKLVRDL